MPERSWWPSSALLGDRLNVASDTCNLGAYLAHWIELFRELPRQLFQVLRKPWQAADLVAPAAAESLPA